MTDIYTQKALELLKSGAGICWNYHDEVKAIIYPTQYCHIMTKEQQLEFHDTHWDREHILHITKYGESYQVEYYLDIPEYGRECVTTMEISETKAIEMLSFYLQKKCLDPLYNEIQVYSTCANSYYYDD